MGVTGVLVFVQHNNLVAVSQHLADAGVFHGEPGSKGHLLPKGDKVFVLESILQLGDQRQQLNAVKLGFLPSQDLFVRFFPLSFRRRQFLAQLCEQQAFDFEFPLVHHMVVKLRGERK